MTTRTKFTKTPLALGALAAALALPLTVPVSAGEKTSAENAPIVVRSQAAMEQWQKETTKDLNRALARDPTSRKVRPNNSIVEVAFELGYDGKAENIRIVDGNGNWSARRAAKAAVRSLGTLDDVPVRNPEGTRFLAAIVFADDREIHEKLTAKVAQSREQRFASMAEDDRPILLGG
ncbi:hypothetical protein ACI5KX_00400 [Erythrobacter sp. GH1-10]|uniref:hypothetical protein n=1 Tax=Erythrobacter sp. GH1-10 TaxID=3349334 RepID=UPI0038784311